MNKQLTKKTIGIAASAALMASLAFSGSALAGPGNSPDKGDRDPSQKICEFMELGTTCSTELRDAYDKVGGLLSQTDPKVFLSGNPDKDAGTLQCKLSGAELKYATDKSDEAVYIIDTAIDKVVTLDAQGKLLYGTKDLLIDDYFKPARDCIQPPPM